MAYTKPQAIIHQEFTVTSSPTTDDLRAVIVGPNAKLHRNSVISEKEENFIGNYGTLAAITGNSGFSGTDYENTRSAGGIVDLDSVKLNIDNALLAYYVNDTVTSATSNPLFYADSTRSNALVSKTTTVGSATTVDFNFVEAITSTGTVARAAGLNSRDVKVGDYVRLQGTSGVGAACVNTDYMISRVIGFINETSDASLGATSITPVNSTISTSVASNTITPETYTNNSTTVNSSAAYDLVTGGSYDGYDLGSQSATFVITPELITTANCGTKVKLHITEPTLGIDYYDWLPSDSSSTKTNTIAGTGVTFYIESDGFTALTTHLSGANAAVTWKIKCDVVAKPLQKAASGDSSHSTFNVTATSAFDTSVADKLILTCTKGGFITSSAGSATFSARTLSGTVLSTGFTVNYTTATSAIGASGLNFAVIDASTNNFAVFTGDVIEVTLNPSETVAYGGLLLADDIPSTLRGTGSSTMGLNIALMEKRDIEIAQSAQFIANASGIQLSNNFTIPSEDIVTSSGNAVNLTLVSAETGSGDEVNPNFNKMYLEYREWIPDAADSLAFCDSVSSLDDVPGQLDPANPLKYAVYKALANSNGASVGFVAVTNPDVLDKWQDALEKIEGSDEVYTVVPTTTDRSVQNLVNTLIQNESDAEACHWKTAVFALHVPEKVAVVSNVTAQFQSYTDGNNTTKYNKLVANSNSANFLDKVKVGDVVAISGSTATYIVDDIQSAGTLYVKSGPASASGSINVTIWHTLTKADAVEYIQNYAQSFSNRRVVVIWPDYVGEAGVKLEGYFAAAAIAGLKSGVDPTQGLTRLEVAGFDDFSRTRPYFTKSQLIALAGSGVWILTTDSDGTPYTYHAITTSTTDINYKEEMMTRNMDSICKYLFDVIDRYIGVTIINQTTLNSIHANLVKACDKLINLNQINSYDSITVKQHDLLSDRVEARITASLPYATNNVELYVTAERAELEEVTLNG